MRRSARRWDVLAIVRLTVEKCWSFEVWLSISFDVFFVDEPKAE